jgi:hypothetical protein
MKFTNERYPFIKMMLEGRGDLIDFSGLIDKENNPVTEFIVGNITDCNQIEFQTISQTFLDESIAHAEDMLSFYKQLKPCAGCILEKNYGIFYVINADPDYVHRGIFAFILKDEKMLGWAISSENEFDLDKAFLIHHLTHPSIKINWHGLLLQIILLNLLKQFAKTEIHIIGGKKGPRKIEIANIKYLSDLPISVIHYDCSFFRECIRTEGFSVRTHLRLQPCGIGRSSLKFIIINAYKKNGYHRRAKKDLQTTQI